MENISFELMVDEFSIWGYRFGTRFSDSVFRMRKRGPCFHCGIDRTPLWRNGPPEKPVLCNACGSRYRLGKPLENYTPKCVHIIRKTKPKAVLPKSVVTDYVCYSSSSIGGYASSESSTSHNVKSFTIKQEIPDDNPVENMGRSWRIHSRKRSPVVYSDLTTIQKLQRGLHNILRDDEHLLNSIESEDDVLIYDININKLQVPSNEIGLGIILLKSTGN